eukprot:GFUD01011054.1.p1 GENE.GFUD01011054.1~~GFUD01011054.1.p1  ORF type:complete len:228 (+),score=28.30 GFUD01011054.1:19-702(+)
MLNIYWTLLLFCNSTGTTDCFVIEDTDYPPGVKVLSLMEVDYIPKFIGLYCKTNFVIEVKGTEIPVFRMEEGCLELFMRQNGRWAIGDDNTVFLSMKTESAGLPYWRTVQKKEKITSILVNAENDTKELTICKKSYENSCLIQNKSIQSTAENPKSESIISTESSAINSKDMTTAETKENQKQEDTYLPIYIGGGFAVVILSMGKLLTFIFVQYPDCNSTICFARFV